MDNLAAYKQNWKKCKQLCIVQIKPMFSPVVSSMINARADRCLLAGTSSIFTRMQFSKRITNFKSRLLQGGYRSATNRHRQRALSWNVHKAGQKIVCEENGTTTKRRTMKKKLITHGERKRGKRVDTTRKKLEKGN